MTIRSRIPVRAGIIAAAALFVALFAAEVGRSQPGFQGNPRPGGGPANPNVQNPNPQIPQFQTITEEVWTCEKCGKEVGTGPVPPKLDKCPHCGVRIGYYRDPDGTKHETSSSSSSSSSRGLFKLVIFGVVLVVGGIGWVIKKMKGDSTPRDYTSRRVEREPEPIDEPKPRKKVSDDKDEDFDFSKIK